MGDSTILGSKGTIGSGSLSSVENFDANTVPTQHYTQQVTIGSSTVYLTPADAERFGRSENTEFKVQKDRTTREAAVETFKELVRWLRS
jgi:hypothetical protein